jgi:hypothetical protein
MTVSLNGALVHVAADFCGNYSPYQGIQIRPNPSGSGVFVASTDAGRLAFLAYDHAGKGDEEIVLLPTADLLKETRPLKSASRWLEIEGSSARCSKLTKTTTKTTEIPITRSAVTPPDLVGVMKTVAEQWGKDCPCVDAGNFNAGFLQKAFRAIESLGSSVTLSHLNGGPLRIESTVGTALVMLMPETARPIPELPDYLLQFANS